MAVIIICAKIMPPNDPEYAVKQTGEVPKGFWWRRPCSCNAIHLDLRIIVINFQIVPLQLMVLFASIKTSVPIYQGPGAKPYIRMGLQLLVS